MKEKGLEKKQEESYLKEKFGIDLPLSKRMTFLAASLIITIVLMSIGIVTKDRLIMVNMLSLSVFIVLVPQFLLIYERYRDLKEMEEKFPIFLRDVIESLSAGLPLHQSIINSSKFDYGKLTPEVRKMANQITWGIPLPKVLDQFAERVKKSKRMFTSIKIINESHQSGGDVISTLNTVTDHSNLLEEAEKERTSLLNQYVVLMYAISIIFIIIVVAINRLMLPIFEVSAEGGDMGQGIIMSNPCSFASGPNLMVCRLYEFTGEFLFGMDPYSISTYYVSLFFFMSLMQSIFSGLVAGQIGENSVTAGLKHSLILVFMTVVAFMVLLSMNIIG